MYICWSFFAAFVIYCFWCAIISDSLSYVFIDVPFQGQSVQNILLRSCIIFCMLLSCVEILLLFVNYIHQSGKYIIFLVLVPHQLHSKCLLCLFLMWVDGYSALNKLRCKSTHFALVFILELKTNAHPKVLHFLLIWHQFDIFDCHSPLITVKCFKGTVHVKSKFWYFYYLGIVCMEISH